MKILIATQKPFAQKAVDGIKEILTDAGFEVVMLERYEKPEELVAAVADVDGHTILLSDLNVPSSFRLV